MSTGSSTSLLIRGIAYYVILIIDLFTVSLSLQKAHSIKCTALGHRFSKQTCQAILIGNLPTEMYYKH